MYSFPQGLMTFNICTREKELGQTILNPLGLIMFSKVYQILTKEVPNAGKMENLNYF